MLDFTFVRITALWLALCSVSGASAAVLYSEADSGDLSDEYDQPTVLTLEAGSNTLTASLVGGPGGGVSFGGDIDLFTLVVPDGLLVTELNVLVYSSAGDSNVSFLGLQLGGMLSHSPNEIVTNDQIPINFITFGAALIMDTDDPPLLERLTAGRPLRGVAELEAGSYAFWLNETGAGAQFTLEFVGTSVPEPSVAGLALAGLAIFNRRRRYS